MLPKIRSINCLLNRSGFWLTLQFPPAISATTFLLRTPNSWRSHSTQSIHLFFGLTLGLVPSIHEDFFFYFIVAHSHHITHLSLADLMTLTMFSLSPTLIGPQIERCIFLSKYFNLFSWFVVKQFCSYNFLCFSLISHHYKHFNDIK